MTIDASINFHNAFLNRHVQYGGDSIPTWHTTTTTAAVPTPDTGVEHE